MTLRAAAHVETLSAAVPDALTLASERSVNAGSLNRRRRGRGATFVLCGTSVCVMLAGGLKGGHQARQERVCVPRRAGSVPSTPAMASMHNFHRPRVRLDVLVALVITPDQIASARRVQAVWEGCQRLAPHAM